MYIIHEQRQKSSISIISIYLILAILLLILIIFKELPEMTKIILGVVLLIDILIFKFFYELTFRITNQGLEFGFGIFKNKVARNNIESVLIDSSKNNFFGYGIRFGKDKTMGFIAKSSKGLRVIFKDQRKFFITMNNPEEALDILKQNKYI
ncbi:hypothetical protein K8R66_02715 [bacterium]|nr:hypothetical protein [bacterium]